MSLPEPSHQNSQTRDFGSSSPAWVYPPNYYFPSREEEISLLDYWRIIIKRKWLIVLVTVSAVALSTGFSLLMKKKYKAEATIMPITSSNSGSGGLAGMASQIGSLPGMGALGDLSKLGGGKTKELVNILKSRTLSEKVINRFDLLKVIFANQWDPKAQTFFPKFLKPVPVLEDAVNFFKKKYAEIEEDKKTGLVKITITMMDPELGAKVANAMILELQEFIESNSLTTAKRNRIFIEEQLVKIKAKLLEADKEINQFYGNNKISSTIPQLDVDVGGYQMVPRPFEDFHEEFLNLNIRQKDAEVNAQHAKVQGVPGQVYLQFLTLNRELLAKTVAFLTPQYEFAKIEEAKEDLAFQVIDKAEVKVRPSSPKIILNVAAGFVGGFFFAVFLAFFLEYIQQMKEKEAAK